MNKLPHCRWMLVRDLPAVLRIEQASFEYPWTLDNFRACLKARNCVGYVAEDDAGLVGFVFYDLHPDRIHLLNFAVAPAHRGEGIGTMLLRKLVYNCAKHGRKRVTAVVREANLPAQKFFRARDFVAVSVLRGYYADSREDGYALEYRVPELASVEA